MDNRIIAGAVAVIVVIVVVACAAYYITDDDGDGGQPEVPQGPEDVPGGDVPGDDPGQADEDVRVLIAYFSRTGTTEGYAEDLQALTGADIVRIETVDQYPDDYTATTEIAQDELNSDARPEISTVVEDMDQYDIILVGYPIWWGAPPMAVLTFLEDYDLSGKTVVTFCTSGSSPISGSTPYIEGSVGDAELIEGVRMTSSVDLGSWLESVGVPLAA